MDPQALQQIVERLQQANTVLITISRNPTLDQVAACIGMSLFLNKLDKHAAAVFSGEVPSVLEFLNPEFTIEQNTDSLRDFIISLDKSKADKLRYKVEGDVVKIFITPYRTSLSGDDFEFSQGDFNVEAVIALGVMSREDLDESILAHGRILHDATVVGVSSGALKTDIGAINLHDDSASGLSEMAARICAQLDPDGLDDQIATALLTGLVAQTDRFRNQNTSPQVMQLAAQLMAAGANQQLVANELEKPLQADPPEEILEVQDTPTELEVDQPADESADATNNDGSLSIDHAEAAEAPSIVAASSQESDLPVFEENINENENDQDQIEGEGNAAENESDTFSRERIDEKPQNMGQLTANTEPEMVVNEPSTDPMSFNLPPKRPPIMSRGKTIQPMNQENAEDEIALPDFQEQNDQDPAENSTNKPVAEQPATDQIDTPAPAASVELPTIKPSEGDTLADIERLIGSAHAMVQPKSDQAEEPKQDLAEQAKAAAEPALKPIDALNALPMLENLNSDEVKKDDQSPKPEVKDPTAPPEVPPPINMAPQFFNPAGKAE